MQITNETPRKEITIKGTVLKVIAPYAEGHVLTSGEANVLNQTLAENLRNNFAERVTKALEAGDTSTLQTELDAYIAEYEFGHRRAGAPAVDPVTKIAIQMAKDAVKNALTKAGKNPKDYTAEQIAALAQGAVDKNPIFRQRAEEEHNRRKAAAQAMLELSVEV